MANDLDLFLLPAPASLRAGPGVLDLRPGLAPPALPERLERALSAVLAAAGVEPKTAGVPLTHRRQADLPPQSYHLQITRTGIALGSSDDAGAYYGLQTLLQILRQSGPTRVPCLAIDDVPAIPTRGVMLDISRDKVPTMATLFALVDRLSHLKFNHVELYMEHTFAYRNHEVVWQHASPLTADEIRAMDRYCRDRFVDLVPNQNSLGHFHRWLKHPAYVHLAESPHGFRWPWGGHSDKRWSLCPTDPRSIDLLRELYDELLPLFGSRRVNVGCDEPFDVGQGRSAATVTARGRGSVWLDHVRAVHGLVTAHGKEMMFWGDVLAESPYLAREIPRDAIVLEWGYEADHPFDRRAASLAAAGVAFFLCPGTSSWNTLAGRTDNALGNLAGAAEAAMTHGASGVLVTDWGDNGHRQYLPISFLGFAAGGALSWGPAENLGAPWPALLDRHVFFDEAGVLGRVAYELGQTYQMLGKTVTNASLLFELLRRPPAEVLDGRTTPELLARATEHVTTQLRDLARAEPRADDGALIVREFMNAGRLQLHALARATADRAGTLARDADALKREMAALLREHEALWMARNRSGGYEDSVAEWARLV